MVHYYIPLFEGLGSSRALDQTTVYSTRQLAGLNIESPLMEAVSYLIVLLSRENYNLSKLAGLVLI